MPGHDAVHHRKPQTRAFVHRLGGEERLEHPPLGLGVHAGAVVAHPQVGAAVRLRVHPDLDLATRGGQRLSRVGHQVHQHLVHLGRIHPGPHRRRRQRREQSGRGGQGGSQKRQGLLHQALQGLGAQFARLLAAEGQHLPHQRSTAQAGAFDLLQPHPRRVFCRQGVQRQSEVAPDGPEDVVEVVRDAAGQRADRVQALGVPKLLLGHGTLCLGAAGLGGVGALHDVAFQLPGLVAQSVHRGLGPAQLAIGRGEAVVINQRMGLVLRGLQSVVPLRRQLWLASEPRRLPEPLPQHRVARQARARRELLVVVDHPPVDVEERHELELMVEGAAEQPLQPAQLALGLGQRLGGGRLGGGVSRGRWDGHVPSWARWADRVKRDPVLRARRAELLRAASRRV